MRRVFMPGAREKEWPDGYYCPCDFREGDLVRIYLNYGVPKEINVRQGFVLDTYIDRGQGLLALRLEVKKRGKVQLSDEDFGVVQFNDEECYAQNFNYSPICLAQRFDMYKWMVLPGSG